MNQPLGNALLQILAIGLLVCALPATIDAYLANVPDDARATLAVVRATILALVPEAASSLLLPARIGHAQPPR